MGGLGLITRRRAISSSPTEGKGYLKFADAEAFRILMGKGVSSDGVGITKEDAAKVTSIGTWFLANTVIVSFDEFEFFTAVTALSGGTNATRAFAGCTSLESVSLPITLTNLGTGTFQGCTALRRVSNLEYVSVISENSFNLSGIEEALLDNATSIGNQAFYQCSMLKKIRLKNVTNIANRGFRECRALEVIIIDNPTPPTIASNSFLESSCPIYVPDASVDAYKAATNWSGYASRIKPLSEYNG